MRMGVLGIVGSILLGVALVLGIRVILVRSVPAFIPANTRASLSPPTRSLEGMLSSSEGAVKQLVRDASDYTEATPGGKIRQGESLETAQGTAAVSLPGVLSLSIGEHTELSFVNLIPGQVLFQQKSGDVVYQTEGNAPVSIRILHSLVEAQGIFTISLKDSRVICALEQGSLKLGMVDTANTTHTYTIRAGEELVVDDKERTVQIR